MPGAARLSDICTGHGSFSSRPNVEGSPDTYVNGLPVHRMGDAWAAHGCAPPSQKIPLCGGSMNTLTNGRPTGRCTDLVCCGSTVARCSTDVFING